ncbi:MAG: hypothetical protein JO129_02645 [Candidatus Dependentiae bacterium]|nr:hypothetical protein [Candidatus Dependentiae bacterium]
MKKLHGMILLSTMIIFYANASEDAHKNKKVKNIYDTSDDHAQSTPSIPFIRRISNSFEFDEPTDNSTQHQ